MQTDGKMYPVYQGPSHTVTRQADTRKHSGIYVVLYTCSDERRMATKFVWIWLWFVNSQFKRNNVTFTEIEIQYNYESVGMDDETKINNFIVTDWWSKSRNQFLIKL